MLLLVTLLLVGTTSMVSSQGIFSVQPAVPFFLNEPFRSLASFYHLDVFCINDSSSTVPTLVHSQTFNLSVTFPINVTIAQASYCFARVEGQEVAGRRSYWFSGATDLGLSAPSFVPAWCTCMIVAHARPNAQQNTPLSVTLDLNSGQFNSTSRTTWPTFNVEWKLGSGSWTSISVPNHANTTSVTFAASGAGVYEFRYQMVGASGQRSIYTVIETTPLSLIREFEVTVPSFVYSFAMASTFYIDFFCINQTGQQELQLYETVTNTNKSISSFTYKPSHDAYCFVRVDALESAGRRSFYFGAGSAAGLDRPSFVPTWCKCQIVAITGLANSNLSTITVDLNNGGQQQTSQFTAAQRTTWPTFSVQWRRMGDSSWTTQTLANTVANQAITLTPPNNAAGFQDGVYQIRYQMVGSGSTRSIYALTENIPVVYTAPTVATTTSAAVGVTVYHVASLLGIILFFIFA